jgi:glycosyltransferase involved in cell wall biosynthesis
VKRVIDWVGSKRGEKRISAVFLKGTTDVKICFVAEAGNVHTRKWVQYFVEKGHEILVLSHEKVPIPGVQVFPGLRVTSRNWLIRKFEVLRNTWTFWPIVRAFDPDILHVHYISTKLLWYWGVKNLFVSPWGSDVIADYSAKTRRALRNRFVLRQAQVITATSHFLADVTRHYTDKEVHVVPFGVDCQVFRPTGRINMTSAVTLGFVKHLKVKYGPEYLIRAVEMIVRKYPQTRLLMAGSGELCSQLEGLTGHLGLTRNVSFLGAIEHHRVPELLRNVDIFVMPSIREGFGVAAVEAQAMEIPVVATKVGGVPEVVLDGESGILVEPGSSEQLAQAILTLIENPALRRQMGERGRGYVLANYRWEDNAALMENLYQQVLQSSNEG